MKSAFLKIREGSRLEQDEAATALGISVHEIEEFESGLRPTPYPAPWLKKIFDVHYLALRGECLNQLFGIAPLTLFRSVLGYSLERTARLFGYSPEEWRRFELHQEQLSEEFLSRAERCYRRRQNVRIARTLQN